MKTTTNTYETVKKALDEAGIDYSTMGVANDSEGYVTSFALSIDFRGNTLYFDIFPNLTWTDLDENVYYLVRTYTKNGYEIGELPDVTYGSLDNIIKTYIERKEFLAE